jgi:hypothetical protein
LINALRIITTFTRYYIKTPETTKFYLLKYNEVANMQLFDKEEAYDWLSTAFIVVPNETDSNDTSLLTN